MKRLLSAAIAAALLLSPFWAIAQDTLPPDAVPPLPDEVAAESTPPASATDDDAVENLDRGPIHEAFADQIPGDLEPPPVVAEKPPEPINEVPPEVKPDDDSIWIPGYFMWSEAENDFVWISGVWRVPPPGRRWTPGHWVEAEGGWQWIAGFWAEAETQQLNYLPYPPESLDTGPTSPAPSADYYWVNGCWLWESNQYVWQPGYWNTYRADWTWIPHHYVWSPRGVVFCGGYWDYPLARRGLLFAPIRYLRPIYHRPGYYYRPHYAVRPADVLIHLFVNYRYRQLCYGDFYGSRYRDLGYRSWGHYHHRHSYLPSYAYYQSHFRRQGVDFRHRLDAWSDYYDRRPDYRPSRTVAESRRQAERFAGERNFARESVFTRASDELADRRRSNGSPEFRRMGVQDRDRVDRDRSEFAEIRGRRERIERAGEDIARADRTGRLPGDRDQRQTAARPTLDLPDHLADADRRQRFENQMRQLRERNLDRGSAGDRTDSRSRSFADRSDRSDNDRAEMLNRLNAARNSTDRDSNSGRSIDRAEFLNRLNAARENSARSSSSPERSDRSRFGQDNSSRAEDFRRRLGQGSIPGADSNRPDAGRTERSFPVRDSSRFGSGDQRPSIDLNQLRERLQNQPRTGSSTSPPAASSRREGAARAIAPQPSPSSRSIDSSRFRSNPLGDSIRSRTVPSTRTQTGRTPSARAPSASPPTARPRSIGTPSARGPSSRAPSVKPSSPASRSIGSSRFGSSGRSSAGPSRSSRTPSASSAGRSGRSSIGGASRSGGRSSSRGASRGGSSGRSGGRSRGR